MPLQIDIYMSEGCGSYYALKENLEQALTDLVVQADVAYHTYTYEDALRLGINGSPSFWMNGKDVFPGGNSPGLT